MLSKTLSCSSLTLPVQLLSYRVSAQTHLFAFCFVMPLLEGCKHCFLFVLQFHVRFCPQRGSRGDWKEGSGRRDWVLPVCLLSVSVPSYQRLFTMATAPGSSLHYLCMLEELAPLAPTRKFQHRANSLSCSRASNFH